MRLRRYSRRNEAAEESHGIDLAPMLDFVLNLLIFFIITAVFVKEMGVMVNRAGGITAPSGGGTTTIPIAITQQGEIWVDNRAVDLRAVRANVERLHAVNPKSGVLLIADPNAPTGTVVEVVDQVHEGGIYNVSFGTTD